MISAFGVEHGEVSKGLKPLHKQSMLKEMVKNPHSRKGQYGVARLAGNKKQAAYEASRKG